MIRVLSASAMVLFMTVVLLGAIGPETPTTPEPVKEEDCCLCTNSGSEHHFSSCILCEETPEICTVCEGGPETHPGCHANYQVGACDSHDDCAPGEEDADFEELLALLDADDEDGALRLLIDNPDMPRVTLNSERQALQLLNCSGTGFLAHIPVSGAFVEAVSAHHDKN